ncbi:MAG: hypothetical protein UEL26_07520, partial [Segatella copri]|nr:hypothetical protein [Segatella copri]
SLRHPFTEIIFAKCLKIRICYFIGTHFVKVRKKITEVTVYSNMGTPKLIVNGEEISGMRKGYTDVHYIFDKVKLSDGKNSIKAEIRANGKLYEDQIEWIYSGEQNRGSDNSYNQNEHGGL